MAEVKWIRLNVDMFDNRKIRYLRNLPAGNDIILIWVMLLTLAGKCNAGGMIMLTQNVPYTIKMLSDEFGFEENTVTLAIEAFVNLGMVSNDGFIAITGWEEHQNVDGLDSIREYHRIKKQQLRERQKQKQLEYKNDVRDMSEKCPRNFQDPSISISDSNSISISESINNGNRCVGGEGEKAPEKKKEDPFILLAENDEELLEALKSFEAMRNRMKKPMVGKSKALLVGKLRKFDREDWIPIIEQSILHGWDSVYPLHDDDNWGDDKGVGKNWKNRHGRSGGKNNGTESDYSDLKYIDPDDESTW